MILVVNLYSLGSNSVCTISCNYLFKIRDILFLMLLDICVVLILLIYSESGSEIL